MATFTSLPNEILVQICNEARDFKSPTDALASLNALSRTSRRLAAISEKPLYEVGIQRFKALPLAWAAHTGRAETARKALEHGTDPNTWFSFAFSAQFWDRVGDALREEEDKIKKPDSTDWMPHHDTSEIPELYKRHLTPTFTRIDVLLPTGRITTSAGNSPRDNRNEGGIQAIRQGGAGGQDGADEEDEHEEDWEDEHEEDWEDEHEEDWEDEEEPQAGNIPPGLFGNHHIGVYPPELWDDDEGFAEDDFDEEDEDNFDDDQGEEDEEDGHNMEAEDWEDWRQFGLGLGWNAFAAPKVRKYTALHMAAKRGHNDVINVLLDKGADIEILATRFCTCPKNCTIWEKLATGSPGAEFLGAWSPLHMAICYKNFDTGRLLISRGADVMQGGNCGYTALHQLAYEGDLELLREILDANKTVNIDVPDERGLTPLYYALLNRRERVLFFLVSRGATIDPRIEVRLGAGCRVITTPLGETCCVGNFVGAEKLVDLGADIRQLATVHLADGTQMELPLPALCCMYSLGDTLEDFRDVDHVATTARCRLRTKLITRLVKGGAAHEWTYNNGRKASALFLAARNFRWDAILGLLEADVDVNASDEQGTTALMILLSNMPYEEQFPVQSGRPRMCFIYDNIQAFLDFGVELNAQDSTGKTALHHFFQAFAEWPYQQWTTDNAKDALEFLLEEGADPLIRDTNGVTAFEMAVKCKHIWAVKMMSTMCQSPRLDLKESFGGPREVERLFFATGCAHQYDPFHDDDNDDRPRDVGLNEHGFMPGDGDFDRPIDYWDAEGRFEASEAVSEALIKMLCDLDRSKFYTSDISFFISCLPPPNLVRVRSSRQHTMLMIARVLCSRGLDVSKLDSKQIKSLFKRLRRLREWDMVCELLDSVPDAEVDSVGDDGETLLFGILAHGNMDRASYMTCISKLAKRGADCHRPIDSQHAGFVMTPLTAALIYQGTPVIRKLLSLQPIKGNADAAKQPYLCDAVRKVLDSIREDRWYASMEHRESARCRKVPDVIRLVMESGADPAVVNDHGATAWSMLLSWLIERRQLIWNYCCSFKVLSPGVDIHRKNVKGESVISYLQKLLATDPKDSNGAEKSYFDKEQEKIMLEKELEQLNSHFEIVRGEDGRETIVWKQTECLGRAG